MPLQQKSRWRYGHGNLDLSHLTTYVMPCPYSKNPVGGGGTAI
ncbi:hypothetical protein [Microseira wollei]|nr:hypothetical protein [Microseira wollei]